MTDLQTRVTDAVDRAHESILELQTLADEFQDLCARGRGWVDKLRKSLPDKTIDGDGNQLLDIRHFKTGWPAHRNGSELPSDVEPPEAA